MASWLNLDGAAVKEIVHQTNQFARSLRDQCVHRFVLVEEARPRHLRDLWWKRRTTVKEVVAFPQRLPFRDILLTHRTNSQRLQSHRFSYRPAAMDFLNCLIRRSSLL